MYLIFSWTGFWAGHVFGDQIGLTFFSLGPLRLGMATLGAFIILGVGFWLSLVERHK